MAQEDINVQCLDVSPNDANRLLAAAFLSELSELLKKHNAIMVLERCWDSEYESHAELDFEINGQYFMGNWSAAPLKKLDATEIMKLSQSCG